MPRRPGRHAPRGGHVQPSAGYGWRSLRWTARAESILAWPCHCPSTQPAGHEARRHTADTPRQGQGRAARGAGREYDARHTRQNWNRNANHRAQRRPGLRWRRPALLPPCPAARVRRRLSDAKGACMQCAAHTRATRSSCAARMQVSPASLPFAVLLLVVVRWSVLPNVVLPTISAIRPV